MNDKVLSWAAEIQSIAQTGLYYCRDRFCQERYERLRGIAAEMLMTRTDIPAEKVKDLFCGDTGYQTPKVDTRAAIFRAGSVPRALIAPAHLN